MPVYVIGHKKPDTDTIVSAMAYAEFKKRLGLDAVAARAGELNPETKFVFEKFGAEPPVLLENARGKKLILVDHNEASQMVDGYDEAEILEIIDHHRLGGFVTAKPIFVHIEPIGSTTTIIAKFFFNREFEIPADLAKLMVSAILSDTVIFRSPTCTEEDKEVAHRLAEIAGLKDLEKLGIDMFKAKSRIAEKTPREIILTDFKEYIFGGVKVGIGQVETVDLSEVEAKRNEILREMKTLASERNYGLLIMMLTDIINRGSLLLYVSQKPELFKEIFGRVYELEPRGENAYYIKGLMSRKKQVVPPIQEYLK